MNAYAKVLSRLETTTSSWLVTGVAGFIGSNLLELLLKFNQKVVGLDDFSTGHMYNLDEVRGLLARRDGGTSSLYKGYQRHW